MTRLEGHRRGEDLGYFSLVSNAPKGQLTLDQLWLMQSPLNDQNSQLAIQENSSCDFVPDLLLGMRAG